MENIEVRSKINKSTETVFLYYTMQCTKHLFDSLIMHILQDIKCQSLPYVVTANFVTSYQEWKLVFACDTMVMDCLILQPWMAMPASLSLNFTISG